MRILSEKKSKKKYLQKAYKVGSVCCFASTTDPTPNCWCQKLLSLSRCLSIRSWVLSITRIRPQNFLVLFCFVLFVLGCNNLFVNGLFRTLLHETFSCFVLFVLVAITYLLSMACCFSLTMKL